MKIAIVLCSIVAAVIAAPTPQGSDDFRNEFDQMIVKALEAKVAEMETFMTGLSNQLTELEKSHSVVERAKLLLKVDTSIAFLVGAKAHLEQWVKTDGLNFLEQFNLDLILRTVTLLQKEMQEVRQKLKSFKMDSAEVTTPPTGDFRNEYDRLLVAITLEHFHDLEVGITKLTAQFAELEKTKDKKLQAEMLKEIDGGIAFINGAKAAIERELKRTDLNLSETFNFELPLAMAEVFVKDFTALANKVKAIDTK